jgi:hypothetical protein
MSWKGVETLIPVTLNQWPTTVGAFILETQAKVFKEPYTELEGKVQIANKTEQVPVVGETWDIEALILSLVTEYEITAYYNIDVRYKNTTTEITQTKEVIETALKNKKEALTNQRTSINTKITRITENRTRYKENQTKFETSEATEVARAATAGVKEGEYNTKATEAISKKEPEQAQFYEGIAARFAAEREAANGQAAQYFSEVIREFDAYIATFVEQAACNVELETIIVEEYTVFREERELKNIILRLENERKLFGRQEVLEIVGNDPLSLKLQLEFTTTPFFIAAQPPFNRQTISTSTFEQIEVEGVHFAKQTVVVREHFDARVDMDNPVGQIQQQNVLAHIQVFVPPHVKPVKVKDYEGGPFVNELKIAVSNFTLQCQQTGSLAKSAGRQ